MTVSPPAVAESCTVLRHVTAKPLYVVLSRDDTITVSDAPPPSLPRSAMYTYQLMATTLNSLSCDHRTLTRACLRVQRSTEPSFTSWMPVRQRNTGLVKTNTCRPTRRDSTQLNPTGSWVELSCVVATCYGLTTTSDCRRLSTTVSWLQLAFLSMFRISRQS